MLSALSSSEMIVLMSVVTLVFIFGFLGYLGWKFFKLSGHKPQPGEKVW
jgi:cytochrome bd-type quinol oxidase subunit 2